MREAAFSLSSNRDEPQKPRALLCILTAGGMPSSTVNRSVDLVDYARDPVTFTLRCDELNVVMAFSGFHVRKDVESEQYEQGEKDIPALVSLIHCELYGRHESRCVSP